MSTVKVYEIADDLKMETETVLHKIRSLGIDVKNKMSKIDAAYVDQIKSSLAKDKQASYIEVEVAPGVIKRKPIKQPDPPPPPPRPARPTPPPVMYTAPTPVSYAAPERAPRGVEAAPREERIERTERTEPVAEPVTHREAPVEREPARVETNGHNPREAPEPVAPPVVVETRPEPVVHAPPVETRPEPVAPPVVVETRPEPVVAPVAEVRKTDAVVAEAAVAETPRAPVQEPVVETRPEPVAPVAAQTEARETRETREEPARTETLPVVESTTVESASEVSRPVPVVSPETTNIARRSDPAPARAAAPGPTTDVATQPPRPSVPPAAKPRTGVSVWNPDKKTVEHIPTPDNNRGGPRNSLPPSANTAAGAARPNNPMNSRKIIVPTPTTGRPNNRPMPGRSGPGGPMNNARRSGTPAPSQAAIALAKNRAPAAEMAKHKRVIKIEEQISLQELARRMSMKATDVLMKLLQIGGMGKNINSTLDSDTAKLLANEFGYEVEDVALDLDAIIKAALPAEKPGEMVTRGPVVTVMGHVDHGKTTLLDAILGLRVAEGELGGITQEVRAYRVITEKGPVVFFDTPGHEAFTELRSRGAKATDVAVLVVAADDGVMPTTIEAIKHARLAKVPIVVAINKMDRPDANPDRVTQQLMVHGVVPEKFGGEEQFVEISAKTRMGVEELLEKLALLAEVLELKANPKKAGVGTVFEAKLDKGKGAVARVLVQDGTIRSGDVVLAGTSYGRIRAMFDDRGKPIEKAGPSVPVEILGLSEVPTAGDKMYVVADMRKAQEVAEKLKSMRARPIPGGGSRQSPIERALREAQSTDQQLIVGVVIKADAQGAVEGLKQALTSLSTEKVRVEVLHAAVGAITESDVQLAVPSNAVVIGFNVRPAGKAAAVADEHKIELKYYGVIYEAVDDIKALMVGQLKPTLLEKPIGKAEVRMVFNITKTGAIAGCLVVDGMIKRSAKARLVRDGAVKWDGKLASLRRIKDDVKEVGNGFECGIGLENYADLKPGDVIEAYEVEEIAAQL